MTRSITDRREEPEFYWEGGLLVFTAAHHRKRGSCCGSACRHCPFGWERVPKQRLELLARQGRTGPEPDPSDARRAEPT